MTAGAAERLIGAAGAALRAAGARVARQGRRLGRQLPGYGRSGGNGRGAFVLLYHRVGRPARDPWGLAVSPEHFAEHLAVLRRHATPMSLAALAGARAAGTVPRDAVAVTFDDGYADNLHEARPLLAAHDVPATVFLATGFAGHGARFWWDEVDHLFLGSHPLPASLRVDASSGPFARTLPPAVRAPRAPDAGRVGSAEHDGRRALYLEVWRWLARLDGVERAEALHQLREAIGAPDDPLAPRALTAGEVTALVAGGLVDAGAHTVSHPMLPALPLATQRSEIVRSKAEVEALVGRPASTFSYPHGRYDERTAQLAREAGFVAVGTVAPEVGPYDCRPRRGDLLHVRRVPVLDWDGETLLRKLRTGFDD